MQCQCQDVVLPLIHLNVFANITIWRESKLVISNCIETLKTEHKINSMQLVFATFKVGAYMALKRVQETLLTLYLETLYFASVADDPAKLAEKAVWNCEYCPRQLKVGRDGRLTKPIQTHI